MPNAIVDCMEGTQSNYILPFLWLHGEDEAVLRDYMRAINSAGIRAVCLESRPHPDFLGKGWWNDLDIILEEARSRNMKVWILDDYHFPTGQAGGAMKKVPASLQKQYLDCNMVDVWGPQQKVKISVSKMARVPFSIQSSSRKLLFDDDEILAVVAARLDGDCALHHVDKDAIDLTDYIQNGNLRWNVPVGMWHIFVFYKTHNSESNHYINLVDSISCKVLIDTVYEAHYAHYAADFGKTIAGFFSDEPGLGNTTGDALIGRNRMKLPWSSQMELALVSKWGNNYARKLPAMWGGFGSGEETARIRMEFMNCLTELVKTCFSEQIGSWCRAHGVEYIGHIIEDNNASEGLGVSTGHYFRSLWGQDMAGIDDIGAQITVGGANTEHISFAGSGDGEFYHHVLGKLGSSLAHIDPKKKDRCVCECFGAYGWSEGTQLMKYIADHLLADGVNYFVPHAFSAKQFPDMDCPPHFYAGGEDILFPAFGNLMRYMNRMSHVLSSYKHTACVAVLYHADAAWSGGRWMKLQKVARVLRERQIDFDILPSETLRLEDGRLKVNGRSYDVLIIPGCEYLSEQTICFCKAAKVQGFPVLFAGFAPEGMDTASVSLEDLPDMLQDKAAIHLSPRHSDIRCYHGMNGREEVYFLFNSSPWAAFEGKINVGSVQSCYIYDAMGNHLYHHHSENGNIQIKIAPCESVLILFTDENICAYNEMKEPVYSIPIKTNWKVSYQSEEGFISYVETNLLDGFDKPGYSGMVRYECTVTENIAPERILLELPQVRETASVWCNGWFAGEAIAAPFVFELTEGWKLGENHLRIDVVTTMEQKVFSVSGGQDLFTLLQKVWPVYGLTGTPILRYL